MYCNFNLTSIYTARAQARGSDVPDGPEVNVDNSTAVTGDGEDMIESDESSDDELVNSRNKS